MLETFQTFNSETSFKGQSGLTPGRGAGDTYLAGLPLPLLGTVL